MKKRIVKVKIEDWGGMHFYSTSIFCVDVKTNKLFTSNINDSSYYPSYKSSYKIAHKDIKEVFTIIQPLIENWHDKYSYCHGRSTLGINYNGIAIYYNRNTEFDRMMLEELKQYYSRIITVDSKFEDQILDDYQMLIQSMYLTKYIAEKKSKDLSKVEYSPIVKKLYKYNGHI